LAQSGQKVVLLGGAVDPIELGVRVKTGELESHVGAHRRRPEPDRTRDLVRRPNVTRLEHDRRAQPAADAVEGTHHRPQREQTGQGRAVAARRTVRQHEHRNALADARHRFVFEPPQRRVEGLGAARSVERAIEHRGERA